MRNFKLLISFCALNVLISVSGYAQSWTQLKSMPVKLTFPVVDVLDGDIHVVGGGGATGATDLHLRYTVATNTWDTLEPVPYLAQQPGGCVVNGKLHYFGGGYPNSGTRLDDHYSYDPSTDKWTKEASLPIPRVIHKTAVLGDSIYVMSGQPDKLRVDLYSSKTKSWRKLSDLPDNDFWYSGITTTNGIIYRFGGGGSGSPTLNANVYNAKTDSWSDITSLPEKRHAPDAVVLGDSIYIGGGYLGGLYKSGVWIYNISKNSYSRGPWFNEPKAYHNMVRVGNCIYSLGGNNTIDPDKTGVSLTRFCQGDPILSNVTPTEQLENSLEIRYDVNGIVSVTGMETSTESITVRLLDMSGKIVFEGNGQHQTLTVNTSTLGLTPAVYLICATQGRQETIKKIQVQ